MSNILDTRDLQERLEELEGEYEGLKETVDDLEDEISDILVDEEEGESREILLKDKEEELETAKDELKGFEDSEEYKEIEELNGLKDEVTEWEYGNTLIPEDDFVEYVEELVKDCGYISKDLPWFIEIDWEATAEHIKMDYSTVEYQGETYLYRMS